MTDQWPAFGRAVAGVAQREEVLGSGGCRRSMIVLASRSTQRPRGTLISLHGSGLTAEAHIDMADLGTMASRGWIVVVPRAVMPFRLAPDLPEGYAWAVPGVPLPGESTPRGDVDDVGFLTDLVRGLPGRLQGQSRGVHLSGWSGGARLASHIAGSIPDVLTLSCVSGLRAPPHHARYSPRVLAIHARDDPMNPYNGGVGPRWHESVAQAANAWAARHEAAPLRTYTHWSGIGAVTDWPDLDGGIAVRLIALSPAGHGWPGSTDPLHIDHFGPVSPFSASREIDRWGALDGP